MRLACVIDIFLKARSWVSVSDIMCQGQERIPTSLQKKTINLAPNILPAHFCVVVHSCWFITFGLMPTVLQCRDEVLQFLLVDELIIEARMPKIKNLNDVIPNLLSNHTDGHDVVGVKLSELIIYRKICNKHSWLVIKVIKIFFQ